MRKILVILLTSVLIFSFSACSEQPLTYIGNMGYDLSKVDYVVLCQGLVQVKMRFSSS